MTIYLKRLGNSLKRIAKDLRRLDLFKTDDRDFISSIRFSENLSADAGEFPLRFEGTAISEGIHSGRVMYTAEELIKAKDRLLGKTIFINHDTGKKSIGTVVDVIWNDQNKSIDFVGIIDDNDSAIEIMRENLNKVSVNTQFTSWPGIEWTTATDIDFGELSLLPNGQADKKAKINGIIK